jgi:hypothetical protein
VINIRVLFMPLQAGSMPLKFLENLGFEVGIAKNFENFKNSGQCGTAVPL